ncbi:LysR family transcriptional regulator [Imbroritus primus]|uniref:LysR family transcriptional regulator n=1 Tax=Imbroritus primus TaxID=3058603 RepID=UPI003D1611DC
MHYDLTDLKVFLAVAEARSLSRGAARCYLSPSSVSLRIKGLEETIGAPLLRRRAHGVELTHAGAVMVEHVRRCLAQLEQMHADLLPFARGIKGHITLFANNNAISSHLPADLARFFARHAAVRITLEERPSLDIVAAVVAGRADLGVIAVEQPHPELRYLPYREDELVLLVPLSNPLAALRHCNFSVCLSEPFVSLQSGMALHTFLANHAAALGGKLDVRVQVSGYRAIAQLVASGAGIGVVPRSALEQADRQHLAVLDLDEPWAMRHLQICLREQSLGSPFVAQLIDTLCENAPGA